MNFSMDARYNIGSVWIFALFALATTEIGVRAEGTPPEPNEASAISGATSSSSTDANINASAGAEVEPRSGSNAFMDIFTEETSLSQAKTFAFFLQARAGKILGTDAWEVYTAMRLGGDSRTFLDQTDTIYNDNYAFFGVGLDYIGLISGLRLTLQLGRSFDLNPKIQLEGWDGRAGFSTSHEWEVSNDSLLHGEIASEALYIQRYRNILSNIQLRTFFDVVRIQVGSESRIEIAPAVVLMPTIDSLGFDYNRIFELRMGLRARLKSSTTVMIGPYYVIGKRWQEPTEFPNYQDFRFIFTLATKI